MRKILLTFICMIPAMLAHASDYAELYQIDIIAFSHEQQDASQQENQVTPPLMISNNRSITLKADFTQTSSPYHLRSTNTSLLKREYRVLDQQPEYQILFHYTWLQPGNNQRPVKLPAIDNNGWQVEGTLRIRQSNYFLLDTDLFFSTADRSRPSFLFNEKKRMKADTLYYLDHPQAGMLIKIHKLS